MAFDREAAKADGYTDEQIDAYLASKEQPLPTEQPIDRSSEQWGTATSAIPTAVELGAVGYGVKKLTDAFRGGPTPTSSTQPGSPSQILQQFGAPKAGPVAPATPTVAPSTPTVAPTTPVTQAAERAAAQEISNVSAARNIIQKIALDKVLKGSLGLGLATYSPGLNQGEEQELARRRAMGFRP